MMKLMLLLKKNPVASGSIAVIVLLLFMLGVEKLSHAGTRADLADQKLLLADRESEYIAASVSRAKAASDALQRSLKERERLVLVESDLRKAVAERDQKQVIERREANQLLADLESENVQLREWASARIPDDMVDWMLEPAEPATIAAGNSNGQGTGISISTVRVLPSGASPSDQ